jgi:hypothetical protein
MAVMSTPPGPRKGAEVARSRLRQAARGNAEAQEGLSGAATQVNALVPCDV